MRPHFLGAGQAEATYTYQPAARLRTCNACGQEQLDISRDWGDESAIWLISDAIIDPNCACHRDRAGPIAANATAFAEAHPVLYLVPFVLAGVAATLVLLLLGVLLTIGRGH